jgi:Tfp pilus assembly protein PilF
VVAYSPHPGKRRYCAGKLRFRSQTQYGGSPLFSFLKKRVRVQGQTGIELREEGIALARVLPGAEGHPPHLSLCRFLPRSNEESTSPPLQQLAREHQLEAGSCVSVTPQESFSLLLLESPAVEAAELKAAAQWRVALLRPDGSRSPALGFEVRAAAEIDTTSLDVPGDGQMKKTIHQPSASERADQRYRQGYLALQQRDSASAERLWQQALTTAPAHLQAREGLIALYLSQGRKVESSKLLQEGVSRHPGHAQFVMLHARLLAEQGHTGEALIALEQAIGNTEPQAELFALAAALYQQQRNYEQSVRVYQRALQMQPQQGHWWMGLGISLEGAGKPAEAQSAYKEALQRGALTTESQQYVQQRLQELQ